MNAPFFNTRLGVVLLILFAAGALALSGCGDGEDGGNGAPTTTPAEDGGGNRPLTPTPLSEYSALELRLEAPSSARLGEHVPLGLTVENTAEGPVQFWLMGREDNNFPQSCDFVVTTTDGLKVWHWLGTGFNYRDILWGVTLEPGEQLRFERVWPQADNKGIAVDPGTYLVHGAMFPSTEAGTDQVELKTEATELVISP